MVVNLALDGRVIHGELLSNQARVWVCKHQTKPKQGLPEELLLEEGRPRRDLPVLDEEVHVAYGPHQDYHSTETAQYEVHVQE